MEDMKLYDIDSGELCELIDSKRIESLWVHSPGNGD